jgi:DNA polymerase-4
MDAFYAAIEQNDNPELRGKPVIVGGPSRRGIVTTASYEARPFGVGSAMPMARALRLCPDAIVVRPRLERYMEVSRQLMGALANFSPRVEPLSLDEAFVEMTGAEGLFGTPRQMGEAIRKAVFEATDGLTVSVGVANTKYLAKVASDQDKPDGLTVVPPDQVRAFLDPLPVRRLWGVGPVTEQKLLKIGLKLIGDVAEADPRWLRSCLGSLGVHIYRLAQNDDERVVTPGRRAKSVGAENTLEHDIRGAEAIKPYLLSAADRIGRRLRRKSFIARGVRVKLKTNRFVLNTRQMPLTRGTDNADVLYKAACDLLQRFDLKPPMRLVGLAAYDLCGPGEAEQGDLFDSPGEAASRRLDSTIDLLYERFGRTAIVRARDVDNEHMGSVTIGEARDD